MNKLIKIKGDASFREFYRNPENESIIVISKKEKIKNLLVYDAINKILIKNNILAPKLLSENYLNKYIEIEDFGDQTYFQVLKNKKNNRQDQRSGRCVHTTCPGAETCTIFENFIKHLSSSPL